MPPAKTRSYSYRTKDAIRLLGKLVQLERKKRNMSEAELSERAGIHRLTLRKVEQGAMTTEIGLAFELAHLVGVPLFGSVEGGLSSEIGRMEDKLALLPSYIREKKSEVKDDF